MKTKYKKPVVRDLGETLASAAGICLSGSIAQGGYVGGRNDCNFGGLATGGNCTVGESVSGCVIGQQPDVWKCFNGGTF